MTLIVEGIVQGTPTTISGNWVNVSGESVNVSGQAVTVSGDWVDISGAYLASGQSVVTSVSGQSVFVYISGGTISVATDISGQIVTISGETVIAEISGQVVTISGETVIAEISGQSVFVYISGGTLQVNVSGDAVTVSGDWVNISGESVVALESITTAFAWQSGTGATAVANTYTTSRPVYLDRVDYSAISATITSSTLYVYHDTADGFASSILLAVNMVAGSPKNIIWLPDTNPYIVLSGDSIKTAFTNPDSIDFYTRTVVSWR